MLKKSFILINISKKEKFILKKLKSLKEIQPGLYISTITQKENSEINYTTLSKKILNPLNNKKKA